IDHGTDLAQLHGFEPLADIGDRGVSAPGALRRRSGAGAPVVRVTADGAEPQVIGLTLIGTELDGIDAGGQRPSVERRARREVAQCLFSPAFASDAFVLAVLGLLVTPPPRPVAQRCYLVVGETRHQLVVL